MKNSTKLIGALVVIAVLVGAAVYFGNTKLQKGSIPIPSPAAPPDFLIEYTFPLDPALPPGSCSLETGQSINFINNSNEPIVVSNVGFSIKGNDFSSFSLGNFSLRSAETKDSPKYIYSSTLKKPGIIYFDLSPQALNAQNLPLVVIQPKSKAHYWFKTTAQSTVVLTPGTTITGNFSFSPVFAKYSPQLAPLGTPDKKFAPLSKNYIWKNLQVCAKAIPPPSGSGGGGGGGGGGGI